jgi:hypothetical protein
MMILQILKIDLPLNAITHLTENHKFCISISLHSINVERNKYNSHTKIKQESSLSTGQAINQLSGHDGKCNDKSELQTNLPISIAAHSRYQNEKRRFNYAPQIIRY